MPEQNYAFGGGASETLMHPAVAVALAIAALLILFAPRKRAMFPLLAAFILLPMDHVLVLGPAHLQTIRLLALAALLRIAFMMFTNREPLVEGGLNALDKALILYAATSAVCFVILWHEWAALNNQLGFLVTNLGIYLSLRCLIRDQDDVRRSLRALAWIATVIAVIMLVERVTGTSPYALLGGKAVRQSLELRNDRVRAMGPFQHPILAGVFGGTLLGLMFALRSLDRKSRALGVLGCVAVTIIVITANASTPLLAYAAVLLGAWLWPLRRHMRQIRWGFLLMLIMLHLVMKAPVWALIARVDLVGGSSGYHRFQLVDQSIHHFGDWWLLGSTDYANWGWDLWDLSNQYVAVGLNGGILALGFFVAAIAFGFKYLGSARKAALDKQQERFFWLLGAALFAHVVAFFGSSYFDQILVSWYALLVMISAVASPARLAAMRDAVVGARPERTVVQLPAWPPQRPVSTVSMD